MEVDKSKLENITKQLKQGFEELSIILSDQKYINRTSSGIDVIETNEVALKAQTKKLISILDSLHSIKGICISLF
jgi:hypothetical protein